VAGAEARPTAVRCVCVRWSRPCTCAVRRAPGPRTCVRGWLEPRLIRGSSYGGAAGARGTGQAQSCVATCCLRVVCVHARCGSGFAEQRRWAACKMVVRVGCAYNRSDRLSRCGEPRAGESLREPRPPSCARCCARCGGSRAVGVEGQLVCTRARHQRSAPLPQCGVCSS